MSVFLNEEYARKLKKKVKDDRFSLHDKRYA